VSNVRTNDAVEEYQRRRREFRPLWDRNFLFIAFPGFGLFGLGSPMVLDIRPLVIIGFLLFGFGLVRGLLIARRHLRCPVCDRIQSLQKWYRCRICRGCGSALSHGWGDS
jgi:hypothetical protein